MVNSKIFQLPSLNRECYRVLWYQWKHFYSTGMELRNDYAETYLSC